MRVFSSHSANSCAELTSKVLPRERLPKEWVVKSTYRESPAPSVFVDISRIFRFVGNFAHGIPLQYAVYAVGSLAREDEGNENIGGELEKRASGLLK